MKEVQIMAYQKRESSDALDRLFNRVKAMKAIEPGFVLDNGLTAANLDLLIHDLQESLSAYNQTLSDADDKRLLLIELEKQAQDAAERLLASALARFGRDSVEYQRIGGKLKSKVIPTGSRPSTFEPAVNGTDESSS